MLKPNFGERSIIIPRDFRVVTFGTHDELAPSDEEDEGVERNVMN